jgi:hypothetical protein
MLFHAQNRAFVQDEFFIENFLPILFLRVGFFVILPRHFTMSMSYCFSGKRTQNVLLNGGTTTAARARMAVVLWGLAPFQVGKLNN